MKLNVSLAQMNVFVGEPDHNLAVVLSMAESAAHQGADVLVLPELWSSGYDLRRAAQHAAVIGQGIFAQTAELAAEFNLTIVGSCISLLGENQYGNTAVLFGPDGKALAEYSKIHLFGSMDEDQYLTAGDQLTLVDTKWGRVGLAICYDLRFPELFRAYATGGAGIIFLVAEWPHPRLAHWRTLIRARAIENQLFVVACNRVGTSGKYTFFGHSTVVDPCGEVVIEGGEGEMLLTAEIDLNKVEETRANMPVFKDRRADIYNL